MWIKKVYIIWWSWYIDINNHNFQEEEADYLSWKMKNSTYWFDITKFFIDKYWKDNVINCLIKWEWEYKNIFWYKWYFWNNLSLIKELWNNRKNSLVIFHWLYPWLLIYSLIPTKHKTWWRHAIIWPYSKIDNKIKRIALWFIQNFFQLFIDTIFYVNDNEKKELEKYKYNWSIFFLPIPIKTDFWKMTKRMNLFNINNVVLTIVWSVCTRKNQEIILKSIKKLNLGNNITLNIIWPWDQSYINKLNIYIKNNNLQNIIFHWQLSHDNIIKILDETDIYIQSSFQEWQCQTVMEAWLTGCPMILSDIPTFKDTFEQFALFFNPNNSEELWNKINEMIKNHYKYNNNIELINYIENWSIKNFFKQLEKFNTEILKYEQNSNTHN